MIFIPEAEYSYEFDKLGAHIASICNRAQNNSYYKRESYL
jgi:hypothetical protein